MSENKYAVYQREKTLSIPVTEGSWASRPAMCFLTRQGKCHQSWLRKTEYINVEIIDCVWGNVCLCVCIYQIVSAVCARLFVRFFKLCGSPPSCDTTFRQWLFFDAFYYRTLNAKSGKYKRRKAPPRRDKIGIRYSSDKSSRRAEHLWIIVLRTVIHWS